MDNQGFTIDNYTFTISTEQQLREIKGGVITESETDFTSLQQEASETASPARYIIQVEPTRVKRDELIEVKGRRRYLVIDYEILLWVVFGFITVFSIVERFLGNGDNLLGRKAHYLPKLWGERVGETATNIYWAVTGRLLIVAQNLMFYTMMWCVPNILSECAPDWLIIRGIIDIHRKVHRIAGVFLIGIPVVAHVLVVFVPPVVDRTKITYHPPNSFNYSHQFCNLNWSKFWDPAAVEGWSMNDKHGVHMTSDEMYRLVLMLALFGFLFPVSRSRYLNKRSYSIAVAIHAFAGVWYSVDNIRKISHALAQIFNLPVLIMWCIDRLLSFAVYRRNTAQVISIKNIGNNQYLDVRLKLNHKHRNGIGDVFYVLDKDGRWWNPERAHPFTVYNNHSKDTSWDVGLIIAVMEDSKQWYSAWTRKLCRSSQLKDTIQLTAWGPYCSAVMSLRKELLMRRRLHKRFVLIASGSGFGYLLDTLGTLAYDICTDHPTVDIHYTVRGEDFRLVYKEEIEHLLGVIRRNNNSKVNFTWYATGCDAESNESETSLINLVRARINFESIIGKARKDSIVYFVGRPNIADHLDIICKKNHIDYVKDCTNSQRGKSDKVILVKYLKWTFIVVVAVTLVCVILGVYFRR